MFTKKFLKYPRFTDKLFFEPAVMSFIARVLLTLIKKFFVFMKKLHTFVFTVMVKP